MRRRIEHEEFSPTRASAATLALPAFGEAPPPGKLSHRRGRYEVPASYEMSVSGSGSINDGSSPKCRPRAPTPDRG
jgi:hypothetical protein